MQRNFYKTMTVEANTEIKNPFRLEYYILQSEVEGEGVSVKTYGIEIIKKQVQNGVVLSETKTIKNICASHKQIEKLAELLVENLVTPITLQDIIDDLVIEQKISLPKDQQLLDELAVM